MKFTRQTPRPETKDLKTKAPAGFHPFGLEDGVGDVSLCLSRLKTTNDWIAQSFWLESTIQTMMMISESWTQSAAGYIGHQALHRDAGISLSAKIREAIVEKPRRLPTSERLKVVVGHLQNERGSSWADFRTSGWQALDRILLHRKKLTHPERLAHLFPTGALPDIQNALLWVLDGADAYFTEMMGSARSGLTGKVCRAAVFPPPADTVLDQQFEDRVSSSPATALAYARAIHDHSFKCHGIAMSLVDELGFTPPAYRFATRAFATLIERQTFVLGRVLSIVAVQPVFGALSEAEAEALDRRSRLGRLARLELLFSLWGRVLGTPADFPDRAVLGDLLKRRDRFQHPRNTGAMSSTAADWQAVLAGGSSVLQLLLRVDAEKYAALVLEHPECPDIPQTR